MSCNPLPGPQRLPNRSNSKEAARKKAEAAQNERNLKLGANRTPLPNCLNPVVASRIQAQAARSKQRYEQAILWRTLWIGGLVVVAIFTGLELLKPAPMAPVTARIVTTQERPVAAPAKRPAATVAARFPQDTPAPPAADASIPQPPPVATKEESAYPPATESDRLAGEGLLVMVGPESQRASAVRRDQELLGRTIEGKAWNAYRGLLARSVNAGIAKLPPGQGLNRFDPLWNEPVLYQGILRWRTLGCFSQSEIVALVCDRYTGETLEWLLRDNKAMEELLATIHPKDDGGRVLKFLMDARAVHLEDYQKYFPLAVACAVVFDNPMSIPHLIGSKEYGPESVVDPVQRYRWYVGKNEKGKLAAPVHHSSARDLVWVVCAPVTTSELEWSIDKMHLRRKTWGDAYGMIKYLMERAVEGLDPYEEYSFAEILKEGGICGDQAYFCVNTARAQGIPAMTIGGETDLGGHAWAGIKIDAGAWTTGVGRVGGAAKGQAENPQTGGSVSEQEIQSWNDRLQQSPLVTLSVRRHLWLADFYSATENADDNAAAILLANRIGHSFTETWRALYSLLERQTRLTGDPAVPENLDEWKSFAKDMRREFKDNPRMAELAADAEVEFIFPYGSQGDAKRTLLRERRRIERDSGEQKDLIATSLKREAEVISKKGGPDGKRDIMQLYDRALRDYGGSVTGFKMMAEDYFGYFKGDPELARKAARDIELAFKRVVETGAKDWFRAETELGIYRQICGYYRVAGDPERAEMLEKRGDVLLRRAKRSAL